MVREIQSFACTITAGTAKATPATVQTKLGQRLVRAVSILFPAGCAGLVGVALSAANTPVIPFGLAQWLVADGEDLHYELDDQIQSGQWALVGYNLGSFDHTIYVRYELDLPPLPSPAPVSPLNLGSITGSI